MRITDLLNVKSIQLQGAPQTKSEALDQMVELMCAGGNIKDSQEYRKVVYAREEESTTGIGEGIAIPHGKSHAVERPGLAAMVVPQGVEFDSLDGQPVQLIFLIAAPNTEDNVHLDVLSRLSVLLMDEAFTEKLKKAKNVEEFLNIIDEAEQRKNQTDSQSEDSSEGQSASQTGEAVYIAAVTGCPTGIAHTYMAAEALEKAAKKLGCEIKVETRGSGGAKNVLTEEEIQRAECIIVAADTKVPMERFRGKKLIHCQVSDGISRAEKLISEACQGTVQIYQGNGEKIATGGGRTGKESVGHQIYTHLMNGVSHMLPFVVGGGILIAIAFLIDGFSVDIHTLTEAERENFGSITQTAALFKQIGDGAFAFMLPILAGFVAISIADRPGLAVGIVGGYLASVGKSGFLGALAAGFLAGYLILLLKKIFSILPDSLDGIKPVLLYPLLGIFIIGLIMKYAIEPPIGAFNTMLNNGLYHMSGSSKILLGLLLGGMMSIDFGGPINKAAYVFGTASIAAGNYDIMAAVMIGGMVPPCAIALATLVFRKKFTAEERKSGPVNFIMGLGFITEGAIPFAAADPLRVIPACTIGSALAGAISMAFGCTLMAPHGGIFVFPVVGNALYYLIALVAGTILGAGLLGLLKKEVHAE